ncbi:MAG: EVE domain-containing protein, partial [Caldivirga sp.]
MHEGEFSHGYLIGLIKDIGGWLGFRVETEYRIDNFRVDVVFFKEPRAVPFAVVEVHVSGDAYKDLAALKHAYDKYGSRLIYVVARDEDTVLRLINEAIGGAFHEIKDELIIIKADELRRLHEALSSEAIRAFVN